jgi:hypothetical protein
MDKDDKEFLANVKSVVEGKAGFVLVGVKTKDGFEGGIIGQNVSKADMMTTLIQALGMTVKETIINLAKLEIMNNITSKKPSKKVAKKKVASKKKVSTKKTK